MIYSVAFRNLPFKPEKRQVIYVENQYDERINTIIKKNYDWLKWNFKRENLDFVYLPMFFNDEEIKEKVLYYAPYLTQEIMEKVELRSNHLLNYMSHLENRNRIKPSFLFAPKKEDEEWVFQGKTIDFDGNESEITKWFEQTISEIEEELDENTGELYASIRYHKIEKDVSQGMVNESCPDEEQQVEYSSTPTTWEKMKKELLKFGKAIVEEEDDSECAKKPTPSNLDEILEEDVRDTFEAMGRNYEKLRLVGIPLSVIIEYLERYETISKLLITDDHRIILSDYNIEVKMTPLHKAIYLLFITNRKKGIVLQKLEEHHSELVKIYCKTLHKEELNPKDLMRINNLESSYIDEGSSIHYNISKINRYFRDLIDEHLAYHYYITGKPGEPYNITLNDDLIKWDDTYE